VRKLAGAGHGKLYRARLNDADRLIFCLLRHDDDICALMLEVIINHDYGKSRFLRGAVIDEDKIVDCDAAEAEMEAQSLRYLNPERTIVHLLDKPISFDDAQDAIFRAPTPLIIVGGAGSGKTALTLEKLKLVEGEALYVTHSAYLAQNARNLYYANGFERRDKRRRFYLIGSSSNPFTFHRDGRPRGGISQAGSAHSPILQRPGVSRHRRASGA